MSGLTREETAPWLYGKAPHLVLQEPAKLSKNVPEKHVHTVKTVRTATLVHSYDNKRKIKGPATARDTLTEFVCTGKGCTHRETVNLERTII